MLVEYKSTIDITLDDVTLYIFLRYIFSIKLIDITYSHRTTVTVIILNKYKDMIVNTIFDLEDHLQNFEDKLYSFISKRVKMKLKDNMQWSWI